MMMMKGSGREAGDSEIGRTPEQPAVPGRSGAGTGGRRIYPCLACPSLCSASALLKLGETPRLHL